jgi:hypothetical protein
MGRTLKHTIHSLKERRKPLTEDKQFWTSWTSQAAPAVDSTLLTYMTDGLPSTRTVPFICSTPSTIPNDPKHKLSCWRPCLVQGEVPRSFFDQQIFYPKVFCSFSNKYLNCPSNTPMFIYKYQHISVTNDNHRVIMQY